MTAGEATHKADFGRGLFCAGNQAGDKTTKQFEQTRQETAKFQWLGTVLAIPIGDGEELVILSDDAAFPLDLRAWCAGSGHELLELRQEGRVHTGRVRKTHDPA